MRWRVSWIAVIAVVGCSSTHPPAVDRTDCIRCHTVPVADELPLPACVSVLENPHHGSARNVSSCSDCHGTAAWCPADVDHGRFDLRGDHAGWDCADCHLESSISYDPVAKVNDTTQIDCTSCHWHSADRTDPFHLGNGDYEYGPATCLAGGCHGDRR